MCVTVVSSSYISSRNPILGRLSFFSKFLLRRYKLVSISVSQPLAPTTVNLPSAITFTYTVKMTMRVAVPSDLDQLVDVVLATMPSDMQWPYRFVHRKEFPEDHRKYTKMIWGMFVDPAFDDWVVQVIEDTIEGKPIIVAFAAWNVSYVNKRKHGSGYEPQNRKITLCCFSLSTKLPCAS